MTPRRQGATVAILGLVLLMLTGCASLPTSSAPQAIGTVAREPTASEAQVPTPGREPNLLVRDFVKASTDPTSGHAAARQYLTSTASSSWNDGASATIVDKVDVLEDSRSGDAAEYTIRANRVGQLEQGGQYQAEDGSFETRISLVRVDGEWRIDDLPEGTIMDRTQFLGSYQRKSLFFVDPTGTSLVPDSRWVAVSQDQMANQLTQLLIDGPRATLEPAVINQLTGAALRGPITKADGRTTSVGIGLGGIRLDLTGTGTNDARERELMAAQIIWTLAESAVFGPYVILVDGVPIDPSYPDGWTTAEVSTFDPLSVAGEDIGLHALKDGSLVKITETGIAPVSGYFGTVNNLQSVSLSADGTLVAAVSDTGRAAPQLPDALLIGTYGGGAFPVAEGTSVTRPTWGPDKDAVWAVLDGTKVVRAVRDPSSGQVSVVGVNSSDVAGIGGTISELRLSRDGVRAAMIVDGAVYVAIVVEQQDGTFALQEPRQIATGLGSAALSLDWSTGDTVVVARAAADIPIVQAAVDGSRLDGLPSRNLTAPVVSVDASASTAFVADSRAVFEIDNNDPASDRYWREVPGLTGTKAIPVLPG